MQDEELFQDIELTDTHDSETEGDERAACVPGEIRGRELASGFLKTFMKAIGISGDSWSSKGTSLRGLLSQEARDKQEPVPNGSPEEMFVDGMVIGGGCSRLDSFGLQLTAGTGTEAARGVGGHAGVEVGMQFGCMDFGGISIGGRTIEGKRFVVAPVWGFSGGISLGWAKLSAPGLNINLGLSMPFGYYESVGHNINLGAGGSGGGVGASAEVWFGCCTSPLAGPKKAMPIELSTGHWSISTPTVNLPFGLTVPSVSFDLYYPKPPFVSMTPVGGAGTISMDWDFIGKGGQNPGPKVPGVTELPLATGGRRLLRSRGSQDYRNSTLMQEEGPLGDLVDAFGVDASVQVIYSRVCRRFFDGCFDSFQ